jgi:hypothetical protein
LVAKGSEDILKAIGIDPESNIGKAVVGAMQGLVGEEPKGAS